MYHMLNIKFNSEVFLQHYNYNYETAYENVNKRDYTSVCYVAVYRHHCLPAACLPRYYSAY